jgi:uncharacterized protein YecE (DUF72 family)
MKWWIGCSGFYYKSWREAFYPIDLPQRKWFEFYCESFNTVELNVTFYRFPQLGTLKEWYHRSPAEFRFTVKAPRLITHYKRFNDVKKEINSFYKVVRGGLRDKMGTVLFQLHPGMVYSEENLEKILDVLNPDFANVLEFRHESWWNNHTLSVLKNSQVSFCSISYPTLPDDVYKTSPVVYYRFHGVPKRYKSSYSKKSLQKIVNEINAFRGVQDVYAYFNNDIDVAAVRNARSLQRMI